MVSNFRRVHWDYFRGKSIKRDNFFAVTDLAGKCFALEEKKVLLPEGLICTCLLAVHQPAGLNSKFLWCLLFQAEMRKHTSPYFSHQILFLVVEMHKTENRSLTNKRNFWCALRDMWLLVLKFINMTPYLTEKCCFWLPSRNSCPFASCWNVVLKLINNSLRKYKGN